MGVVDQTLRFENPTPTGEAFDPFGFGANYLGRLTTLTGGNGSTVTGRAVLDFGGSYPSQFDTRMTRHTVSGVTTVRAGGLLTLSGGGRFDVERASVVGGVCGTYAALSSAAANATSYTDTGRVGSEISTNSTTCCGRSQEPPSEVTTKKSRVFTRSLKCW